MAEQQGPIDAAELLNDRALERIEASCRQRLERDHGSYDLGPDGVLLFVHALRQARQERDQAVTERDEALDTVQDAQAHLDIAHGCQCSTGYATRRWQTDG